MKALPIIVLILAGTSSLFLGVDGLRAQTNPADALATAPGSAYAPEASPVPLSEPTPATAPTPEAAEPAPAREGTVPEEPVREDSPAAPRAPDQTIGDGGCPPMVYRYRAGSAWASERPTSAELDRFRALLAEHETAQLVVAGHADQTGERQRNLDLSYRRAQRVFRDLAELGFPPQQIMLQAAGDYAPIEGTDRRASVNRRVEVSIRGIPSGSCEGGV